MVDDLRGLEAKTPQGPGLLKFLEIQHRVNNHPRGPDRSGTPHPAAGGGGVERIAGTAAPLEIGR